MAPAAVARRSFPLDTRRNVHTVHPNPNRPAGRTVGHSRPQLTSSPSPITTVGSPNTLPDWAEQLTDTPPRFDHLGSESTERLEGDRQGLVRHEDWELRTETVPDIDEDDIENRDINIRHARQVNHYRTLLIRAQSASSAELHDLHSRFHALQSDYNKLAAEHELCGQSQWTVEGIGELVRGLGKAERIGLLGDIIAACQPSDVDGQIELLQQYKRSCWDILGRLDGELTSRVLSLLDLPDILRLRLVSKRYKAITQEPALWERLCRQLGETPASQYERHYRHLWTRELNWRKGTPRDVSLLSGHTSYVTSLKLKGQTLISGSYDGTIRIWNLDHPKHPIVLPGKAVSCLDYLESDNVLVSGSHDMGRVHIWTKRGAWQIERTLSGHLNGIRAIALVRHHSGADKALVVWDWRTGEKIVKFGQQTNICIGIYLVEDYIVAMTVDGIIRTFSITERDMLGQYKLSDIIPDSDNILALSVTWFAGTGNGMTCWIKNRMIQLEWDEIPPGKEMPLKLKTAPTPIRQRTTSTLSPITPKKVSGSTSPQKGGPSLSPAAVTPTSTYSTPRKVRGDSSLTTPRISNVHLPVITRPPRVRAVTVVPDIERGAVSGDRIVTSTRFAARTGADRQLYVHQHTPPNGDGKHGISESVVPIRGAWSDAAEELQLQTPGKNPMSIVVDREKFAYGCTDGSIIIVSF